jgi:hypothetical protein
MKKIKNSLFLGLIMISLLSFQSCEEASKILEDLGISNEEVVEGLKTALTIGTDTSVTTLSQTDGYFKDELVKILLPAEAAPVFNVLSNLPGGSLLINEAVLAINRAAEDAAPEAKSIFITAVTGITIADGFEILNGGDTAATIYLQGKTSNPLTDAFKPKIQNSLTKPLILNRSAEQAYALVLKTYNDASLGGLLWPEIKTNTLTDHVTQKALTGLFLKIGEEERNIRRNPLHRVNDILKKVFGGS